MLAGLFCSFHDGTDIIFVFAFWYIEVADIERYKSSHLFDKEKLEPRGQEALILDTSKCHNY